LLRSTVRPTQSQDSLRFCSFQKKATDWAKELAGFLIRAFGEKDAQHTRIVKAEIKSLAAFAIHHEEVAEVFPDSCKRTVTSEEHTPAITPAFVEKPKEQTRIIR
jgi:hypothetical protein